jgi:hypothetical protein
MNGDSVFNEPSFEDSPKLGKMRVDRGSEVEDGGRSCKQVIFGKMERNMGSQDVDVDGVIEDCDLGEWGEEDGKDIKVVEES